MIIRLIRKTASNPTRPQNSPPTLESSRAIPKTYLAKHFLAKKKHREGAEENNTKMRRRTADRRNDSAPHENRIRRGTSRPWEPGFPIAHKQDDRDPHKNATWRIDAAGARTKSYIDGLSKRTLQNAA